VASRRLHRWQLSSSNSRSQACLACRYTLCFFAEPYNVVSSSGCQPRGRSSRHVIMLVVVWLRCEVVNKWRLSQPWGWLYTVEPIDTDQLDLWHTGYCSPRAEIPFRLLPQVSLSWSIAAIRSSQSCTTPFEDSDVEGGSSKPVLCFSSGLHLEFLLSAAFRSWYNVSDAVDLVHSFLYIFTST